jgi:ATP-dependent helicase Lhr and Lhr-like helicase
MVHVAAERVTPLAIPLMVVIGREALPPGGAADETLLKLAEEELAAAAMAAD